MTPRDDSEGRLVPEEIRVIPPPDDRRDPPPTLLQRPATLSVAALTQRVQQLLEGDPHLQRVRVEGEVTNYRGPQPSGHHYFALKDEEAELACVLWAGTARQLDLAPLKTGAQVVLTGDIRVYARRGTYQLSVTRLEPSGMGALWLQFLKLRSKLQAEGLFAEERKRPLPRHPRMVGIVTSRDGAALQDMLKILRRRAPHIPVRIAPALVQGVEAPAQLLKALAALQQEEGIEVIIVARGGGSFEDLNAFNDEHLVRALARCTIPVITGVGHETDFTLVDFVSDHRAPTPTAAAVAATPDCLALRAEIDTLLERGAAAVQDLIAGEVRILCEWTERIALRRPGRLLAARSLQVADLLRRGARGLHKLLHELRRDLAGQDPVAPLRRRLATRQLELVRYEQVLRETHPDRLLQRGFALVRDAGGRLLRSIQGQNPGKALTVQLGDGTLPVTVSGPPLPETAAGREQS